MAIENELMKIEENQLSSWSTEELKNGIIEGQTIIKMGIEAAPKVGQLLIELKGRIDHGKWTNYIENNLPIQPAMARRYMQYAKRYSNSDLPQKPKSLLEGLDMLNGTKIGEKELRREIVNARKFFERSLEQVQKLNPTEEVKNEVHETVVSLITQIQNWGDDMREEFEIEPETMKI